MAVTAERIRVSIRAADQDVDLTVAAQLPLRDLLPALADAVTTESGATITGGELRLSRPVTGPLDAALSLAQSGVRDGELLVLAGDPPPNAQPEFDICAAVAAAVRSAHRPRGSASTAAAVLTGWGATVAAVLLGWPVAASQSPRHAVAAAGVGCVLVLSARVFRQRGAAGGIVVAMAVGASGFAALAGWLTVPGGPAVANAALAMSACAVATLAASQACGAAQAVSRSLCAVSASGAVLCVAAVLHWWPAEAVGPALTSGWLGVLSTAPRLVAHRTRLSAADPIDETLTARTQTAHGRLTATIGTATAGAVLGSLLTALATPPSPASLGMLAAVAAVLLLRAGMDPDAHRSVALGSGGVLVSTMLLGTAVTVTPALVPWVCGLLMVGCVVGVRVAGPAARRPAAALRRVASAAQLAAAAAVAPLGCWAAGLFAAARELSLS